MTRLEKDLVKQPIVITTNTLIELAKRKEREQRKHPLIVGFGPQSVGKSTLAELLARRLGGEYIDENFLGLEEKLEELNDLKKKILLGGRVEEIEEATREDWQRATSLALKLELEFLDRKLNQKSDVEMALREGPVFWDASVWTDLIYAETYRQLGIMSEEDYQVYLGKFQRVLPQLPAPDLILGLKVSGEELAKRARGRWGVDKTRVFEKEIPGEFFWKMAEVSNLLIEALHEAGLPVKIIETDEFDFTPEGLDKEVTVVHVQDALFDQEFRLGVDG